MGIERFSVYWVNLDPTVGSEINKTRPCIVVSPDELNDSLSTVIIVPLTTVLRSYPWRVRCNVAGKEGSAAIDHIKTIDKSRLGDYITSLRQSEINALKSALIEMFE